MKKIRFINFTIRGEVGMIFEDNSFHRCTVDDFMDNVNQGTLLKEFDSDSQVKIRQFISNNELG